MARRAREGSCLATLVKMAIRVFRQAERQCPRTGPGRKPEIADWLIALLIMIAVWKRKKTQSAQYRYLYEHREEILQWTGTDRFPARSTYFDRYRRAWHLYQRAIELQGKKAVQDGLADAELVAVDKSLVAGRGPLWHKKDRRKGEVPPGLHGVDRDTTWGYSEYHGWVQGYSYEVVVTATADGTVWPLLASAGPAGVSEHTTFGEKIEYLSSQTLYVLADSGYDNETYADRIERDEKGHRTGKRFLCPQNPRNSKQSTKRGKGTRKRSESGGQQERRPADHGERT